MVDFRRSRILDPAWCRGLRIKLDGLASEGRRRTAEAGYSYYLALVANSGLTEKSFDSVQESARERYYQILGLVRPWEGKDQQERRADEFRDARQSYIDAFGVDPLSPGYQEWEAQRIADVQAGKFDVEVKDDLTKVEARLVAKYANQRKPKP